MAKLVFVTAPMTGGKTRYIHEHRGPNDLALDEPPSSTIMFKEIDRALRSGRDVYVSWVLPEGSEIEWVEADKQEAGHELWHKELERTAGQ